MTWLILVFCLSLFVYLIYSKFTKRNTSKVPITDEHRKLLSDLMEQSNRNELGLTDEQQKLLDYVVNNSSGNEVDLTIDQRESLLGIIKIGLEHNEVERQAMVNQAAREGKKVPLSVLIDKLEKDKEEHRDDEEFIVELDRQIAELKEKFGAHIGVDELYKLWKDYEDENGPP